MLMRYFRYNGFVHLLVIHLPYVIECFLTEVYIRCKQNAGVLVMTDILDFGRIQPLFWTKCRYT